jgi:hypothetical protein
MVKQISLRCPSPEKPSPHGLWSLWDMLQDYLPIYKIGFDIQRIRQTAEIYKETRREVDEIDAKRFRTLLQAIQRECLALGLTDPQEMAERLIGKDTPPESYAFMAGDLDHLDASLRAALNKEAVFRIPPERKKYFEQTDLFGPDVTAAFPSCTRDIKKAGSCYAFEQEDACVHHLMMVLERGLKALAARVKVSGHYTNWQTIINEIEKQLASSTLPRPERIFYTEVNAQFEFLKVAYRNHSEHAHDDPYDMEKAASILIHVREFMQELTKGGLSE